MVPRDIAIGLITGIGGGICVVAGQYIAQICGQEYNLPLIAVIAIIAAAIILVIFSCLMKINSKKGKK